jgi:hypothetical protein
VQTVLCIAGDHFDPVQCKCVPNACISTQGGPCGGFVANPCTCAPGLTCVSSNVPDVAGTCEPQPGCCPSGWNLYSCVDASGQAGLNCHNPALGCPSSTVCGGGCDSQVNGTCPVCDPIPCPSGETFDSTLCACVQGACKTAADCQGALPALCEICGDGGFGCAHWTCPSGACVESFCQ